MDHLSRTTAVLLAGGLGTRLRTVVADRPKVLAEVRGRPFLAYLLDQLADAGFRDAVLCVGYCADQVREALGDRYGPLRLRYSRETTSLGTGGALRQALPLLASDPIVALNGDSYCEVDLPALYDWHQRQAAEATLLLRWVDDPQRYGRVEIDAEGRVLAFREKCQQAPPGWINAGVYVLAHKVLRSIASDVPVSLEREVFPRWIGRGLTCCPCQGRFLDIGTPASYAEADRFFAVRTAS